MTKETPTKRVEKLKTLQGGKERNSLWPRTGVSNVTATKENSGLDATRLMEVVVERKNMTLALKRVKANQGAPGVDEMTVEQLSPYLKTEWPKIKERLLEDRYKPLPTRQVEIPKPGGRGMRMLGIPTVLDRLIQQALHQVLSPIFDPGFSNSSYGFRPGRNTHMAVKQAQAYVASGKRWVIDLDLEQFFDRVNHDILMARVARQVEDKRMLRLIRKYLQAGAMADGLATVRKEGTPQGSPLSPLLSNIFLDDLDKELERRGHTFCRYADDCNTYVASRKAGERVFQSIEEFLKRKLHLTVNHEKSKVDRPWKRKFLGYSMTIDRKPRLKAAKEAVKRFKGNLKETFRKGKGRNLARFVKEDLNPILRGWGNYFQLSEVKITFEELDAWLRRRLRRMIWKQWKRPRTRKKKLIARGLSEERAYQSASNGRGPWWNSGASHMNAAFPKQYFDRLELVSLLDQICRIHNITRTAVYGTVRTVV
jgi:RNA-directed DNA polymerase